MMFSTPELVYIPFLWSHLDLVRKPIPLLNSIPMNGTKDSLGWICLVQIRPGTTVSTLTKL